jgi:hypothetical protein
MLNSEKTEFESVVTQLESLVVVAEEAAAIEFQDSLFLNSYIANKKEHLIGKFYALNYGENVIPLI